MSLRKAIQKNHDKAEKHRFVELLLSGGMPPAMYAAYLYNQFICYDALEQVARSAGLLDGIESIQRAALILQDACELGADETVFPSTREYAAYVQTAEPLLAHIYVRHFADLYGGQLIKRVAPGACRMYEFEDRPGLIAKVRERLSDDLADEANVVFDFALALFDEVSDAYDIRGT